MAKSREPGKSSLNERSSGELSKAIERPIGQPERAHEEVPIGWDFGPEGPPENLTGSENLWLFGRLHGLSSSRSKATAADLLELCRWTARYYLVPVAEVIGTIVPTRLPEPAQERIFGCAPNCKNLRFPVHGRVLHSQVQTAPAQRVAQAAVFVRSHYDERNASVRYGTQFRNADLPGG